MPLKSRWIRLTTPLINLPSPQMTRDAQSLASLLLTVTIILSCLLPTRYMLERPQAQNPLLGFVTIGSILMLLGAYLLTRHGYHEFVSLVILAGGHVTIYLAFLSTSDMSVLYYLAVMFLFSSLFLREPVVGRLFIGNAVVLVLFAVVHPIAFDVIELLRGPILFNLVIFLVTLTISQHRSQLEALRKADLVESEMRYRQIGELMADFAYAISVQTDGTLKWEWVTDSFPQPQADIFANFENTLLQVIHPLDAVRALADIHYAITMRTETESEYRMNVSNSQTRWLRIHRRPFWDDQEQRVTRLYGVAKEITDEKHAQARELEFALQRERLGIVGRFVQAISHDFRTSLAIIETNRYLIPRRLNVEAREQVQHYLVMIQRYVKRLTDQMESLYTVSSLTNLLTEPRHLQKELVYIITEYAFITDARDITLVSDIDETLPPVHINIKETKHALRCLLDNAIIYTPAGGCITLRAYRDGVYAAIAIEDTGHGIEEEHLPHIFDLFYRADSARSLQTGGIGLGLSIVQMIAQAQGGEVLVKSQVGQGSTFILRLPLEIATTMTSVPPDDAPPSTYSSIAS